MAKITRHKSESSALGTAGTASQQAGKGGSNLAINPKPSVADVKPEVKPKPRTWAAMGNDLKSAVLAGEKTLIQIAKLRAEMESSPLKPDGFTWKEWAEKNGVSYDMIKNAGPHSYLIHNGLTEDEAREVPVSLAKALVTKGKTITSGEEIDGVKHSASELKLSAFRDGIKAMGGKPNPAKVKKWLTSVLPKAETETEEVETPETDEEKEAREAEEKAQALQDALLQLDSAISTLSDFEDGLDSAAFTKINERLTQAALWLQRASKRAKVGKVDAFTTAEKRDAA